MARREANALCQPGEVVLAASTVLLRAEFVMEVSRRWQQAHHATSLGTRGYHGGPQPEAFWPQRAHAQASTWQQERVHGHTSPRTQLSLPVDEDSPLHVEQVCMASSWLLRGACISGWWAALSVHYDTACDRCPSYAQVCSRH